MIGWLRSVLLTLLFALLGAAAGRVFAEQRRRTAEDEPDLLDEGPAAALEVALAQPSPRELVPGLVAALRVRDRPWSFLGVPPWAAAFAVNFLASALGGSLEEALERLGLTVPAHDGHEDDEPHAERDAASHWTAPLPTDPPPPDPPPSEGFTPFED